MAWHISASKPSWWSSVNFNGVGCRSWHNISQKEGCCEKRRVVISVVRFGSYVNFRSELTQFSNLTCHSASVAGEATVSQSPVVAQNANRGLSFSQSSWMDFADRTRGSGISRPRGQQNQFRQNAPVRVHELDLEGHEKVQQEVDLNIEALSNTSRFSCWNCRQPGHSFVDCPSTTVVFALSVDWRTQLPRSVLDARETFFEPISHGRDPFDANIDPYLENNNPTKPKGNIEILNNTDRETEIVGKPRLREFETLHQRIREYRKAMNKIFGQVSGRIKRAMERYRKLDSGATVTCLGKGCMEFVKKAGLKVNSFYSFVKTAGGQQHRILGRARAKVTFNDKCEEVTFYLVPSLERSLFLGVDFMRMFGLLINVSSLTSNGVGLFSEDEGGTVGVDTHVLTPDQQHQLCGVVAKFPCYAERGLGRTHLELHTIDTGSATPVRAGIIPSRRLCRS
ncbi:hypothetical protein EVAR_70375_1 [Eumeta japonica]|uniref:CCHC-type domain-containing protein n=1 Tax=Eumeta variegata TaxID=151549 RepID=A0A4C1TH38_EUMVA|nr:hypothetical protein EVAR_70375_1 [Eumeta japonica]